MDWTLIAIVGYMAFGLLLMDFMCPCWHPFEKLIGAIIWPISAVIGIVNMIRESRKPNYADNLDVLQIALAVILAEQVIANTLKEKSNAQEVPKAQASLDQASPHEHGGLGQGLPC